MTMHRRAFTLIEILVAVGLAMLIIVCLTAAFRAISSALSAIQRMSSQNDLLQAALRRAYDEADVWNEHANPDWPYARRYMTDASSSLQPSFRPFLALDAFDPAWSAARKWVELPDLVLPQDPCAWYRGDACQNLNSRRYYLYYTVFWPPKPANVQYTHAASSNLFSIETDGTQPWNLLGDVAAFSHLGMLQHEGTSMGELQNRCDDLLLSTPFYEGGALVTANEHLNRTAGLRPMQVWRMYRKLGPFGLSHYLPAGTSLMALRPPDHLSVDGTNLADWDNTNKGDLVANPNTGWYVGDQANHYDKGEVPWSLTRPVPYGAANPAGPMTKTNLPTTLRLASVSVDNDINRTPDRLRLSNQMFADPVGPEKALFRTNLFGILPGIPRDYGGISSIGNDGLKSGLFDGDYGVLARDADSVITGLYRPIAQIFPARTSRDPADMTKYDWWKIDEVLAMPWRAIGGANVSSYADDAAMSQDVAIRASGYEGKIIRERYQIERPLVPDAASVDGIDPLPAGQQGAVMRLFRYRYKRADRATFQIDLTDGNGESVLRLSFSSSGTDFRGARRLWGQRSTIVGDQ